MIRTTVYRNIIVDTPMIRQGDYLPEDLGETQDEDDEFYIELWVGGETPEWKDFIRHAGHCMARGGHVQMETYLDRNGWTRMNATLYHAPKGKRHGHHTKGTGNEGRQLDLGRF